MIKITYILLLVALALPILPSLVSANTGDIVAFMASSTTFDSQYNIDNTDDNTNYITAEDNVEFLDDKATANIALSNAKNQKEIIVVGSVVRNEFETSKDGKNAQPINEMSVVNNSVDNPKELHAYTRSVVKKDENIREVIYSPDLLFVSYQKPSKLFGLIPFKYTEHVSIKLNQKGDAVGFKFKKPWYMSLLSDDGGTALKSKELEKTVEKRVLTKANVAENTVSINGDLSATSTTSKNLNNINIEQKQAKLLDTVVEFMYNQNEKSEL